MSKTRKYIYWIATIWLALGMLSSAVVQLLRMKEEVDSMDRLGYPVYLLTMLGVCKILGIAVLLLPKLPLLKEWAYAGFAFIMTGAVFSHIASGDAFSEIFPAILLLILTITSWYFRPPDRKIKTVDPLLA